MDKCVICGTVQAEKGQGVTISRCCCDSDWVCGDCVDTKSLADYIAKAVSVYGD